MLCSTTATRSQNTTVIWTCDCRVLERPPFPLPSWSNIAHCQWYNATVLYRLFSTDHCFDSSLFFKNTGGFQTYSENVALTAHLGLHCARCRNRLSWQLASPDPGILAKDYSIRNQKFCNTEAAHCITRLWHKITISHQNRLSKWTWTQVTAWYHRHRSSH